VSASEVVLDCSELAHGPDAVVPERPRIDLVLALPRPKVLARLYAALACIGIGRLYLCNAARVERYYFDSHVLTEPFVRARLLEGLSQARDTRLPCVSIHRSFRKLVEDELGASTDHALRLVADVASSGHPGPTARELCGALAPTGRVLLAVGPEGGWVDFERALLAEREFRSQSFGERVLRTDVAALAALAVLHQELRQTVLGAK
jgi:RsmE family RNA methyltransferase